MKQILHVKAPGNWMNDPNGFIYFNGQYHIFYQHNPHAPVWGDISWGHAVSKDLITWEQCGCAILPSKEYDRDGIFSGSAICMENQMYIFYTGVRCENTKEQMALGEFSDYQSCQVLIRSEDGFTFDLENGKKQIIPVQDNDTGHYMHTKDPKVWKEKDNLYMVLGSTDHQEVGKLMVWKSKDGENWKLVSSLKDRRFGKILECPDLFEVDGQYIFLGSAMYIREDTEGYQHLAICETADFTDDRVILTGKSQLVDYGGDLYATQTVKDPYGKRVMLAWMRMPEAVPESHQGNLPWNGMLTLPRIVTVEKGWIRFSVHPEVKKHFAWEITKKELKEAGITEESPCRIKAVFHNGDELNIGGFRISMEKGHLHTDRRKVFPEGTEAERETTLPVEAEEYKLDIYTEPNLVEIFINDGQFVMSSIVYKLKNEIEGRIDHIYRFS